MTDMTYTYQWYREMLGRLYDAGHTFYKYDDDFPRPGVLLRHDIDYSPQTAKRMAEIESDLGVTGIYFVLVTSGFYNPSEPKAQSLLADIADLGHQIGLHFDSRIYFDSEPEPSTLRQRIKEDQEILQRRVSEITDIVAFHNPPDWVLGKQFQDITHTYEPEFYEQMTYRADSLGRWQEYPPFPDTIPKRVQVLVHPVLWGEEHADPQHRIHEAQAEMVARADDAVEERSRLDWSPIALSW